METINYKNLEWYVINETDKEKLLFLKDCFTHEQILKYFISTKYNYNRSVQFSDDESSPWWLYSYIRKVLNTNFLNDLDINDLSEMITTVELDNMQSTTKDYVRLITEEEIHKLNKTILSTPEKYEYWTMSPYGIKKNVDSFNHAMVFYMNDYYDIYKRLEYTDVSTLRAVRPVISLKKKVLDSGLILSDEEEMIKELKRVVSL